MGNGKVINSVILQHDVKICLLCFAVSAPWICIRAITFKSILGGRYGREIEIQG